MQTLRRHQFRRKDNSSKHAFTFTELLVVLLVLGVLLLILIPAQADARTKSQGVRCLDNLRQIMGAVMMYTHDNHDLFPPNEDSSSTPPGHSWVLGAAGVGGAAQFNPDILANPNYCLLTTYVHTNVSLFLCTADLRTGIYQGNDVTKAGTRVPAARSISMNAAVGNTCANFGLTGTSHGGPSVPVNGPWLDNTHSHKRNTPWRTYGKLSDVIVPGPANLWVMTEEDPYSINDAGFGFGMNIPEWIDFPSTQHGMSCVMGFADSHVELHKWIDPRTPVIGGNVARRAIAGSADWAWLKERTSARAQQ